MRSKIAVLFLASCVGASPALGFVESYQVVSDFTAQDSASFKAVEVECPAGTSVLGGGAGIFGFRADRSLVGSRALLDFGSGDLIGWHAEAQELYAADDTWQLYVYAVCGLVPGLERVGDASAIDSGSLKGVSTSCPAGKAAISGGFQLEGAVAGVALFEQRPSLDPVTGASIGWEATALEYVATSGDWRIRGELYCADLEVLPMHARVSSVSEQSTDLEIDCPAPYAVLGGGARLGGAVVDWIDTGYPDPSGESWSQSYQRLPSNTNGVSFEIFAICPEPGALALGGTALAALIAVPRRRAQRARRNST